MISSERRAPLKQPCSLKSRSLSPPRVYTCKTRPFIVLPGVVTNYATRLRFIAAEGCFLPSRGYACHELAYLSRSRSRGESSLPSISTARTGFD